MGFGQFIKKKFLGKEVCVSLADNDTETLLLEQFWNVSKDFFKGIVKEVVEDIVVLEIPNKGVIFVNPDQIVYMWEPPFDAHGALLSPTHRRK